MYFDKLVFSRAGRFQVAVDVDGLSVDDVQLNFAVGASNNQNFKLVEIGPMSETYTSGSNDTSAWVELFSPDRDITVRNFGLTNVRVKTGNGAQPLANAEAALVKIGNQKPNPDYPKTTPRGGVGKTIIVR